MDSIKDTMGEMMDMFHKRMASFEEKLLNSTTTPSTSNLAIDFAAFKQFTMQALNSLQQQIKIIADTLDRSEMRNRRKILLFHGIPESKQEDTKEKIVDIVKNRFKIEGFSVDYIQRCHRLGRSSDPKRPRPVLVKFKELKMRNELWFHKTKLKGSDITLSEFLTKNRHDIFMATRLKFGVSNCWTRDGDIFVLGFDKQRLKISSLTDLNKILQNEPEASNPGAVPKNVTVTSKPKRATTVRK